MTSKLVRPHTASLCALLLAGAGFSTNSALAITATVKSVRGIPKDVSKGRPVIINQGDQLFSGAVIKTGPGESVDLAIGSHGRVVSVAPNSQLRLGEGEKNIFLERGELLGSVRHNQAGSPADAISITSPFGVTKVEAGDFSMNTQDRSINVLSGNGVNHQQFATTGAPNAPTPAAVNIPAGNQMVGAKLNAMPDEVSERMMTRLSGLANATQKMPKTQSRAALSLSPNPNPDPGTWTLGYWKNHPETWDALGLTGVTVGGTTYTKAQAIAWLGTAPKGDVTIIMFHQLVPALLNVQIGNNNSCIASVITQAQTWMSGVTLGSKLKTWPAGIEALKITMDDYNNGNLCVPHHD